MITAREIIAVVGEHCKEMDQGFTSVRSEDRKPIHVMARQLVVGLILDETNLKYPAIMTMLGRSKSSIHRAETGYRKLKSKNEKFKAVRAEILKKLKQ